MLLCRSVGPISFEDVFTERSIAAKILNLKLNEILHLSPHGNLASYFTLATKKHTKM